MSSNLQNDYVLIGKGATPDRSLETMGCLGEFPGRHGTRKRTSYMGIALNVESQKWLVHMTLHQNKILYGSPWVPLWSYYPLSPVEWLDNGWLRVVKGKFVDVGSYGRHTTSG